MAAPLEVVDGEPVTTSGGLVSGAQGRYAAAAGLEIVESFYDASVSGADPIDERPAVADLLARIRDNGVRVVLVEDSTRFARDLAVQRNPPVKAVG